MQKIAKCEVCGNTQVREVLNLGLHPLCDDLIELGSQRTCSEYPIVILFCDVCLTAHQKYQVPKASLFQESYHYRARMTASVLSGMADLVNSCESRLGGISGKTVLDVGCNDGSLLNFFEEKGCKTIGVEPITFTNVFAHIEDLPELISNLKLVMSDQTVLVIENHYLGAILEYDQFDTFYHEHPRTYSCESFKYVARSLERNLMDLQFVSRYGGNVRAFIGPNQPRNLSINEHNFREDFEKMRNSLGDWISEARAVIDTLVVKNGKLRAKAFPGRAAILVKLLGLTHNEIEAVYEIKGSIKVGHYVPGTRIPILPEAMLYAEADLSKPILNLAWHLPAEVRKNLEDNGYKGSVVDIKAFRKVR
jgi:hypothetical protein